MDIQHFVDFLTMLLKHKTIFLAVYIFLKVGKTGKQITCILVLRCGRNKGAGFFDFIQQILTLLIYSCSFLILRIFLLLWHNISHCI